MRWNPFATPRRRMISAVVVLLLMPVAYLASYPILYRALNGSDMELFFRRQHPQERARRELWRVLDRYYYPPAVWAIDHTPAEKPIQWMARGLDIEMQMGVDKEFREFVAMEIHSNRM